MKIYIERGISFKNSISSYGYSYIINLFIKISKWILIFKFQVFWILIYIMQYLIIDIIFKEELERIIGIKSIEDLTKQMLKLILKITLLFIIIKEIMMMIVYV